MSLDGILAKLIVQVAPALYRKYVTTNAKGKAVLYVQFEKAIRNDEECTSFLPEAGRGPYFPWLCDQSL
jgi:hypothetical protein